MKDIKTQPVADERSFSPKVCKTYTPPQLVTLSTPGPEGKSFGISENHSPGSGNYAPS